MATSEQSSDDVECPTCGRDDFKSQTGMKAHHKRIHGESLAGVTKECAYCGEEFHVRDPYRAQRVDHCSPKCGQRNRTDGYREAGQGPNVTCANCGDRFYKKPAEKARRDTHYCSRGCWVDHTSEASSIGERVTIQCGNCGEEHERTPSAVYDHNFCDSGCMYEFQSGEGHPLWKGGRPQYGKGWDKAKRQQVRERDGYECVYCGMDQEAHLDEFGRKLDVHHIIPARQLSSPEERNAAGNLETCCIPCHRRAEKMAPLRPDVTRSDN